MPPTLREAWAAIIDADDYEAHMAANGQARANAELVSELLREAPPDAVDTILFAGAGTGQMFDYADAAWLRGCRATFTDINAGWLERLADRLRARGVPFETQVDDLEDSRLSGSFSLAIAVLVLEHIDWRRGVASLCRLSSDRVFVAIQRNPPDLPGGLPAVGTMQVLRKIEAPLVDRDALDGAFEERGFGVERVSIREVADGKQMVGLEFRRRQRGR